ncbi:MAG: hypothetical protein U1F57_06450 [bacterium]
MPPIQNLDLLFTQPENFSSYPPAENRILLAQATPQQRDSRAPAVASDAPQGVQIPSQPLPVQAPQVLSYSLAQLAQARRERENLFSEQNLLGSNYAAWNAGRNTTYGTLSIALLRLQYFLEGRQTDTASIRGPLLESFRASRGSTDPVLRDTLPNVLRALRQLQEPYNRERAQGLILLMEQTQALVEGAGQGQSQPTPTPPVSPVVPPAMSSAPPTAVTPPPTAVTPPPTSVTPPPTAVTPPPTAVTPAVPATVTNPQTLRERVVAGVGSSVGRAISNTYQLIQRNNPSASGTIRITISYEQTGSIGTVVTPNITVTQDGNFSDQDLSRFRMAVRSALPRYAGETVTHTASYTLRPSS